MRRKETKRDKQRQTETNKTEEIKVLLYLPIDMNNHKYFIDENIYWNHIYFVILILFKIR